VLQYGINCQALTLAGPASNAIVLLGGYGRDCEKCGHCRRDCVWRVNSSRTPLLRSSSSILMFLPPLWSLSFVGSIVITAHRYYDGRGRCRWSRIGLRGPRRHGLVLLRRRLTPSFSSVPVMADIFGFGGVGTSKQKTPRLKHRHFEVACYRKRLRLRQQPFSSPRGSNGNRISGVGKEDGW
jgi:hypothetical protein